jgi:hypothetical protein
MTLARLRALLKRRLQSVGPADNWTNSDLDELLNEAYVWVQLQFYQANPDGLIHIDYTTLEVGNNLYPWPRGFISLKEMGYLDTTDPFGYRDLGAARDFWVNRRQPARPAELSEVTWSNLGRHFALFPTPPATIVDAIQMIWIGTLTLANDNDVPEIPFNHMSIAVRAQIMAYAEAGDDPKALKEELSDYMSGIAAIPQSNQGNNDRLILTGIGGTTL